MTADPHPALERILRHDGATAAQALLSQRLSGADLTTLLLDTYRRRVERVTPSDVLAQYQHDRFVRPASVGARDLLALELRSIDAVVSSFEAIVPAPLVPFGTHATIADVHQDRVISTTRNTEVAADPTNALALEAALRRKAMLRTDGRSATSVNLVCTQRVTRAQMFSGPLSFPHFSLLGLVTAGRDTGNNTFEAETIVRHLRALSAVCHAAGATDISFGVTDFSGTQSSTVVEAKALNDEGITVVDLADRQQGRGYYAHVCIKITAHINGNIREIGDGGFVNWTQRLLNNAKERLFISALSLERIAIES